jgi:hypothetical protein
MGIDDQRRRTEELLNELVELSGAKGAILILTPESDENASMFQALDQITIKNYHSLAEKVFSLYQAMIAIGLDADGFNEACLIIEKTMVESGYSIRKRNVT